METVVHKPRTHHSFTSLFKVFNRRTVLHLLGSPAQDPECRTHCSTPMSTIPRPALPIRVRTLALEHPTTLYFWKERPPSLPVLRTAYLPTSRAHGLSSCSYLSLARASPAHKFLARISDTVGVNARGAGRMGLAMVGEVRPSPR
jgi:hypothetical protein